MKILKFSNHPWKGFVYVCIEKHIEYDSHFGIFSNLGRYHYTSIPLPMTKYETLKYTALFKDYLNRYTLE